MKLKYIIIVMILLALVMLLTMKDYKDIKNESYEPTIIDSVINTYNDGNAIGRLYFSNVSEMNQLRGCEYVNDIIGLPYIVRLVDDLYYSKHINSDTLDMMYVIYDGFIINSFWYTSKWFKLSDFKDVCVGSSYDDVLKIDASTEFKMLNDYHQKTYHLCETGYIIISWNDNQSKPKVDSIEYVESEIINCLFKKELGEQDVSEIS